MKDNFEREISYARISITDACNLRCIYCMPNGYVPSSKKILSKDEIIFVARALSSIGVKKIRLTGGEPLLRNDIVDIVKEINSIEGIKDIGITTNALLLSKYVKRLKEAGLRRVNISLDSIKADVFKRLTGGGDINLVLEAIDSCIEEGLTIKINMVPIKGINDNEIEDFIELTRNRNIDVRFIELMPIGPGANYTGVKSEDIIDIMKRMADCDIVNIPNNGGGPSEVYMINNFKGRVGIISPMTHKFCSSCNRVRITSDGKLKPCLHNPLEIDLNPYMVDMDKMKQVLKNGILHKDREHAMDIDGFSSSNREMVRIGG